MPFPPIITRRFLALALFCAACKPADKKTVTNSSTIAASTTPAADNKTVADSSTIDANSTTSALLDPEAVSYKAPAKAYEGPRIAPDSLVTEPLLELQGNEWVLRLPAAMARVLYDSLPGFAPYQLSGWQPSTVARMVARDPGAAL
ncbi:MAG TPA: hypothetical protein VGO75_05270, partial [Gemmatimonadaceae bacterium]|nr:hypothetical protein [Gemmatimonadaceae bacterium]